MVEIVGPTRVSFGSRVAVVWVVRLDGGVPHKLAWTPADGTLRVSWPVDSEHWSPFVRLAEDYGTPATLQAAQAAVIRWARSQEHRLSA